jgi:hypothetical protein
VADSTEADPPPKKYGLKPKEFERVNAEPGTQAPSADHDVYAILQANRAREQEHGLGEVEVKAVKSRRRRDYWLLLFFGNIVIVGTAAVVGLNIMTMVYAFSGLILFSCGLTWIMWFVMDDY